MFNLYNIIGSVYYYCKRNNLIVTEISSVASSICITIDKDPSKDVIGELAWHQKVVNSLVTNNRR